MFTNNIFVLDCPRKIRDKDSAEQKVPVARFVRGTGERIFGVANCSHSEDILHEIKDFGKSSQR